MATTKPKSGKVKSHPPDDPTAVERKKDHIEMAFRSQEEIGATDDRFYYEPLLAAHPKDLPKSEFLGKTLNAPLWISSMTGGTELAGKINRNLAQACAEFGLGMGLGSCRVLLHSNEYFDDFNLRPIIGNDLPFYANLGIAQVEQLLLKKETAKVWELVEKLQADGLIIHVNPFQEWLQPEGDRLLRAPIETIEAFLDKVDMKVIIKEVGQGFGPESLDALFRLPLAAIDFAAHGGTNFSKVELMRSNPAQQALYESIANQGHSADEMVHMANHALKKMGKKARCHEVIISGGIKTFLDGYYLINKLHCKSIYGQGSAYLAHAKDSYKALQAHVAGQIEGLKVANAYLRVK